MPRPIRKFSEEKLYHIVLKSINSQTIFENDGDYDYFLKRFSKSCKQYQVKICAYCLMSNHVHLLLKFNDNNLSVLFKSFGAEYVPKYNYFHNRTGSLFKGRYYSKPINDDLYLFSVVRYIHYNPIKAGICVNLEDYKWSSYAEYKKGVDNIVDSSFIWSIMNKNDFDKLHKKGEDEINQFIIDNSINPLSYEELCSQAEKLLESNSIDELMSIMKRAGISKSKASKVLKIDRRKIIYK